MEWKQLIISMMPEQRNRDDHSKKWKIRPVCTDSYVHEWVNRHEDNESLLSDLNEIESNKVDHGNQTVGPAMRFRWWYSTTVACLFQPCPFLYAKDDRELGALSSPQMGWLWQPMVGLRLDLELECGIERQSELMALDSSFALQDPFSESFPQLSSNLEIDFPRHWTREGSVESGLEREIVRAKSRLEHDFDMRSSAMPVKFLVMEGMCLEVRLVLQRNNHVSRRACRDWHVEENSNNRKLALLLDVTLPLHWSIAIWHAAPTFIFMS